MSRSGLIEHHVPQGLTSSVTTDLAAGFWDLLDGVSLASWLAPFRSLDIVMNYEIAWSERQAKRMSALVRLCAYSLDSMAS